MNGDHEKKHQLIDTRLKVLNQELDVVETELELQAAIVTNLADGVMLARTQDGIIVYTNPQMSEMFGYEENELRGKHVSVLNAPCESSKEKEAEKIVADLKKYPQKVKHKDVVCSKKDGSEFICHAKISTFKHKTHGEVWVALHTIAD